MTMRKSGFLANLFGATAAGAGGIDAAELARASGRGRSLNPRDRRPLPICLVEELEARQLLAGDHPSLPGSFNPSAGDPLTIDVASPLVAAQRGRALTGANQGVSGTIAAGDDGDFFRFVMPSTPGRATDFVTVLADTLTNPDGTNLSSTLDTYVEVFRAATAGDPAGQVVNGYFRITSGANNGVLSSTNNAPTPDGWAGFVGTAGTTYYIRVRSNPTPLAAGRTATGSYTLRVDTVSLDYGIDTTPPMPDPPDPATDIFGEGDQAGEVLFRQDDLVYRITTPDDAQFESLATVGAIADDPNILDTHLEVYSDGNANGVVSTIASDIQAGRLTNAFSTFRANGNTTYFIRVRSDELATGRPATGQFSLAVDMSALPIAVDQTTRLSNPDRSDAVAPLIGSAAPGGTSSRVYQFVAQGTGISFITVVGAPGIPFTAVRNPGPPGAYPPLTDPAVHLYNEAGTEIAFNDDANGFTPQLAVSLTGGQRYFIVVEGFDRSTDGGFTVFIEANYTLTSVDDHINTQPTNILNFSNATPIVFGPAQFPTDADGNGQMDGNWFQTGTSRGRIYNTGDTDVFQFVPPINMLNTYAGGDNNMGTALYVGGNFGSADRLNPDNIETGGRGAPNVAIWDSDDWWNAGPGIEDFGLANGAIDGPIRSFVRWDPDGAGTAFNEVLIAGGQFTFDDDFDPMTPNVPTNLAMRVFSVPQNRFIWTPLQDPFGNFPQFGNLTDRVNALTVYDVDGESGMKPPSLIVGGRFAQFGGGAVNNLAEVFFDGFGFSVMPIGAGVSGGATPEVRALTTYDPPQAPDPDGAGPQEQPDDPPRWLAVGGRFTSPAPNVYAFGPADSEAGTPNTVHTFNAGTNGPVNALVEYDSPLMDAMGEEIPNRLYVGGEFTTPGNHIAAWNNAGPPMGMLPQWDNVGALADPVNALKLWEVPGNGSGDDATVVVAGGGVNGVSGFVSLTQNNQWAPAVAGINAPVRALDTFVDDEFDISMGEQLVVGGDFDMIGMTEVGHIFRITDQNDDDAPGLLLMKTGLADLAPGEVAPTSVFAIEDFNDNVAGVWDRNDRPFSRVQIVVAPTTDAFLNAFIRIYDSNFNLIYENETISPFPDPAGSIDPARTAGPGFNEAFVTPGLWGGETYYIEVSGSGGAGTGRYDISVSVDTLPPEVPDNGDGQYASEFTAYTEVPDAGRFDIAPELTLNNNGDGRNYDFITPTPTAFQQTSTKITPSGVRRNASDYLAGIESITDTDLYQFRASATGTVEVRLSTFGITDRATETFLTSHVPLVDGVDNTAPSNPLIFMFQQMDSPEQIRTYNSSLDGLLRVFNNDFEQIGVNDDSFAVGGFGQRFQAGVFTDQSPDGAHSFLQRDPRLVIPVVAGETYFIQVESAYREAFLGADPDDAMDDQPDIVDWRHALGAYELLINNTQSSNGIDDYENFDTANSLSISTAIPFDRATGDGSISGIIDNVQAGAFINPDDTDLFSYVGVNRGTMTVTLTPTSPTLKPVLRIFDAGGLSVGNVTAGAPGQTVSLNVAVQQGGRFYISVDGDGVTEGSYNLTVDGPGITDDHVKDGDWADATPLSLNAFLGQYTTTGFIENTGDSDLFKFHAEQYEIATVNVTSTDTTMNPFVFVWEENANTADPADGHREYRLVAANDDGPGTGTNSQASFSVTAGKDYYVVVVGADVNLNWGHYTVTVDVAPTDDHPNLTDFPLATQFDLAASFDPLTFTSTASLDGRIEVATDDDMFRFIAPASGTATVSLATPASGLAADIEVYDSAQTLLATGVGSNGSASVMLNVTANSQYFVRVRPGTAGAGQPDLTGAYTLSVSTAPIDDYADAGEWASPDVGLITLSATTGVGVLSGIIVPNTDTDLFRFTTLASGNVQVRVKTVGSNLDPFVRIYNSAFVEIPGSTSNGDTASLTFPALAAGEVYYVLVLPDSGASGTTAVGTYSVEVTGRTSTGGGGTGPDDHANAGEFGDATLIPLDSRTGFGTAGGVINYGGDTDLFKFVPAAGGKAGVQIKTPSGGLVDGRVKIYNKDFVLIAQDAAGIPGATAAVNFDTTVSSSADIYYILVEPIGTAQGTYTVEVSTQPITHYLYYPEGFAGSTIDEFVPIVNTNSFAVSYQVFVRYESGPQNNSPIAVGTVNPKSRGGITISSKSGASLVDRGRAYALEIQSTGQLGATLSHYDFNVSVGEAFTDRVSTTWTFAQVNKDRANYRDFLVFYNPSTTDATLTIQLIYDNGTVTSFQQTVKALRRGGVNVDTDGRVAQSGRFGVKITSTVGIVAALSSYNLANNGGDGLLGDADGGTTAGIIPNVSSGGGVTSSLSFLNTNSTPATITVTASYARVDLPDLVRVLTVQPNRQFTISLATLGLLNSQTAGIKFTSNVPVTGSVIEYQNGDGDSTAAATVAAREYVFGDLFVNPAFAGVTYIEKLGLFNPSATAIDVTVKFLFVDGTTADLVVNVGARDFGFVQIDQATQILSRGTPTAFSLDITSQTPIVASLTHYDLFLNGGWSTLGAPIGLTVPVSTII